MGVVQGSVLGPTLYSLYTSDMLSLIKSSITHMYADDTQILISTSLNYSDVYQAVVDLNEDVSTISKWSASNGLVLNSQKCLFMVLGTKNQIELVQNINPTILVNNVAISRVPMTRNLGLYLDEKLTFENHVNMKIGKCFVSLQQLYRLRPYLNVATRLKLVESLIISIIDYCDIVYGPCLSKN